MNARTAHRLAWLTILLAILVAGYSCAGYAMVASLSASNPDRLANYRVAASIYMGLIAASVVAAMVAAAVLARSARTRRESAGHAEGGGRVV
jgi:hypothetical protein